LLYWQLTYTNNIRPDYRKKTDHTQARRQDLEAGGPKTKKGAKNQKGGHIFKIQYWMHAATGNGGH